MSVARFEIPVNFIVNPITVRRVNDINPRVDIVGPASMQVVWGTQSDPSARAATVAIEQIVKPGAPANTVYVYLPPDRQQGRITRRSNDAYPLVTVMGPKSFSVNWAQYMTEGNVPDNSSPDHSRGIGTYIDKQGASYYLRAADNVVMKSGQPLAIAASLILWEKTQGVNGTMWFKDLAAPYRWRSESGGVFTDYNPATFSRTGTIAEARDPETNVVRPAESLNATFGASVQYHGNAWTRGTASGSDFFLMRDGIRVGTLVGQNYLVLDTVLYVVTAAGAWHTLSEPNTWQLYGVVDPRDNSSPDHSRGQGPFTAKQGRVFVIGDNNVVYIDGQPTAGWGTMLLWEKAHRNGQGAMYHKGPSTHRYMWYDPVNPNLWPEYDPASRGLQGTVAEGRDPETNALPPADSANNTYDIAATFATSIWTRGAASGQDFALLRDGVPFLVTTPVLMRNLLVFNGILYWVTQAGVWSRYDAPNAWIGVAGDPRVVVDPSSADHSRGIGPYTDKSSVVWLIDNATCIVYKGGVDTGQFGVLLLWEKTHASNAGRMYVKGYDGVYRYESGGGWVVFDAEGRDPETNALPGAETADTPDGQFYSAATYNHFNWSVGVPNGSNRNVTRDGILFEPGGIQETGDGLVVHNGILYITNVARTTWRWVSGGNLVGDADTDPRTAVPVPTGGGTPVEQIIPPLANFSLWGFTWSLDTVYGTDGYDILRDGEWHYGMHADALWIGTDDRLYLEYIDGRFMRIIPENEGGWAWEWYTDPPAAKTVGGGGPPDSANNTYDVAVVLDGIAWSRGPASPNGFEVLKDGVAYMADVNGTPTLQEGMAFLVRSGTVYWVDDDGDWFHYVAPDQRAYDGKVDPRTTIPPPSGNDAPFKELVSTVDITSGQNVGRNIPNAAYQSMQEGEWYIIEIDTVQFYRGSGPGIYHQFPFQSVRNYDALPWGNWGDYEEGTVWWMREAGSDGTERGDVIFRADPAGWGTPFVAVKWRPVMNNYDWARVLPRSYHGRVGTKSAGEIQFVDLNGNPLIATATVQGAKLIHNNAPILQSVINDQPEFVMPSNKMFAAAGKVNITRPGGVRFSGLDMDTCGFYSPLGVHPIEIDAMQSPGSVVENMRLESNFHEEGYMGRIAFDGWHYNPPAGGTIGEGVWDNVARGLTPSTLHAVQSPGFIGQDLTLAYSSQGFNHYLCDSAIGRRLKIIIDRMEHNYSGWACLNDSSTGVEWRDIEFVCRYLTSGLDLFKSYDTNCYNIYGTNFLLAPNTSGPWLIDGFNITLTQDSCPPDTFNTTHQPIININTNQGQASGYLNGGTLRNGVLTLPAGHMHGGAADSLLIAVQSRNRRVRLEDIVVNGPQYNAAVVDVPHPDSPVAYQSGTRVINSEAQDVQIGGINIQSGTTEYTATGNNVQTSPIRAVHFWQNSPNSGRTDDEPNLYGDCWIPGKPNTYHGGIPSDRRFEHW